MVEIRSDEGLASTGEVSSVILLQWLLAPLSRLVGYQIFMVHSLTDTVAQFLYKLNSLFVAPHACFFDKFDENCPRKSELSVSLCLKARKTETSFYQNANKSFQFPSTICIPPEHFHEEKRVHLSTIKCVTRALLFSSFLMGILRSTTAMSKKTSLENTSLRNHKSLAIIAFH